MDPHNGQTLAQAFHKKYHCVSTWKPWWKIVLPAGPLLLWAMKRGRPTQGGEKIVIGCCGDSLLMVMDREAVARMSGRHWMDLIN